jgi:hypothetical protein
MTTVTNMMTYPSSAEAADVAVALMVRYTWHGQTVSPGSRVLLPPLLAQPTVHDLPPRLRGLFAPPRNDLHVMK